MSAYRWLLGSQGNGLENVLIGYLQLQLHWGRAWCGQMALSAGFVGGGGRVFLSPPCALWALWAML